MLPQPPVAQVAPSVDMTSQRQPACSQPQQQMSPRLPPQSPVTSSHQMLVNPAASGLPVNPQPQPASHHHQQMSPVAGQMSAAQIIGSSQLQLQAVSSQPQIMSPQVGFCYFKSVEIFKKNMVKCRGRILSNFWRVAHDSRNLMFRETRESRMQLSLTHVARVVFHYFYNIT